MPHVENVFKFMTVLNQIKLYLSLDSSLFRLSPRGKAKKILFYSLMKTSFLIAEFIQHVHKAEARELLFKCSEYG